MTTYTKTVWVDTVGPTGFTIDGVPAVIAATGVTPGTAHNATNENHQEQGIYDAQNTANAALAGNLSLVTILAAVYPVGCIYVSTVSTNPNTLFGFGTWAAFAAGRTLVGVGTSDAIYAAAATGGESNHTLITAEMPTHTHVQPSHNHTQNSHTHTQGSHNHTQDPHAHNLSFYSDATDGDYIRGALGSTLIGTQPHSMSNTTPTNNATTATNNNTTPTNNAATATNATTGGDGPHNNMPPYVVVYMFKRTA